ncbi:MAG TPA: sulfatase [Thermoanaerobaculia bacterium]|jgi:arylsulfatase A-like enzyme|nr:sulfatase [Thermoanaerobaculia bacterium]
MRRLAPLMAALLWLQAAPPAPASRFPNVLLITVDTLRADRVSSYGYARPTTPNIDRLLARGVRFAQARTVEPLTTPALASLLTSRYPHEHGATRNGMRLRAGLPSLARVLGQRGFETAAFVGNWTLRDAISGLGEHFHTYRQIASRKRWLVLKGEATGDDLTAAALEWLGALRRESRDRPFLLWVHYVEPHAPYRTQSAFTGALGYGSRDLAPGERYDTEIAFADHAIGELLAGVAKLARSEDTIVAFAGDHGESLGEHGYWGHGRHLYENNLRVPMGITWEGKLQPAVVAAPATLLDLAPTVLGLIGYPALREPRGFDWTPVLRGGASPPHRAAYFQAHKGAVQSVEDARRARRRGLLEVALMIGDRKEVLRLRSNERWLIDVVRDPGDQRNLADHRSPPSPDLLRWQRLVEQGLVTADQLPPPTLDPETQEQLRALGYSD